MDFASKTYIMGILNITPDSFSGDGVWQKPEEIFIQVEQMLNDGADIIDVGGESTRPGAIKISESEELDRVAPIVEEIKKRFDTLISIDTYKAKVAEAALRLGATIVNDVWALDADPAMAKVVSDNQAWVILMHNSSKEKEISKSDKLGASYLGTETLDIVSKVKEDLTARVEVAKSAGVSKIILDPGFGFGKTLKQNLELLKHFNELKDLGYALLSGPSRKSFIGQALDLPVEDRLEGTLAAVALSIDRGAKIVRVHDVKAAKRVATFLDSMRDPNGGPVSVRAGAVPKG